MSSIPLPSLGTTGIGSLAPLDWPETREEIFSLDIPYLPTYPQRGPLETMAGQLGLASATLPLPQAWIHWVEEIKKRRSPWVKLQWPGPHTLGSLGGLTENWPPVENHIRTLIQELSDLGCRVLFFFDEPALFKYAPGENKQKICWDLLAKGLKHWRSQGVTVGLHSCGQAPWDQVLKLPLQFLSFDYSLSWKSLLGLGERLVEWLEKGGRFALGLVPTQISASWDPVAVVNDLIKSFPVPSLLKQSLLTPACGLGLRSVGEGQQVFKELKKIQEILFHELP
jgi:hypothetical protein